MPMANTYLHLHRMIGPVASMETFIVVVQVYMHIYTNISMIKALFTDSNDKHI